MTLLGRRAGPGSLGDPRAWRTRNEAAYTRHYKCMATRPLLHDTHLPLAELCTTYSQTSTLENLHT